MLVRGSIVRLLLAIVVVPPLARPTPATREYYLYTWEGVIYQWPGPDIPYEITVGWTNKPPEAFRDLVNELTDGQGSYDMKPTSIMSATEWWQAYDDALRAITAEPATPLDRLLELWQDVCNGKPDWPAIRRVLEIEEQR